MLRELVRVKEVGLVYRIMIVEDDRELRETLKELLILKNYDVITSGSVKEFDEHTDIYDMYLLDVKLPDGDGFDICERIRHNSDAPIIFITSCSNKNASNSVFLSFAVSVRSSFLKSQINHFHKPSTQVSRIPFL